MEEMYFKSVNNNRCLCECKNGKYLANIIDDSGNIHDEIIESYDKETKTNPANFNEKKATYKMQNFYTCIFINYYSIIDSR